MPESGTPSGSSSAGAGADAGADGASTPEPPIGARSRSKRLPTGAPRSSVIKLAHSGASATVTPAVNRRLTDGRVVGPGAWVECVPAVRYVAHDQAWSESDRSAREHRSVVEERRAYVLNVEGTYHPDVGSKLDAIYSMPSMRLDRRSLTSRGTRRRRIVTMPPRSRTPSRPAAGQRGDLAAHGTVAASECDGVTIRRGRRLEVGAVPGPVIRSRGASRSTGRRLRLPHCSVFVVGRSRSLRTRCVRLLLVHSGLHQSN